MECKYHTLLHHLRDGDTNYKWGKKQLKPNYYYNQIEQNNSKEVSKNQNFGVEADTGRVL